MYMVGQWVVIFLMVDLSGLKNGDGFDVDWGGEKNP